MSAAAEGLWLAPLRGVTIRTFRSVFGDAIREAGFSGLYAPFIPVNAGFRFSKRLFADILPKAGEPPQAPLLVPQVIGKDPTALREWCKAVLDLGYLRADLNAGCPFPMIRRKGRGSGLLRTPDVLERMLAAGCEAMGAGNFSVKTRLGVERTDEWERLFSIFNRYPISELIVHARTMREFYNGDTHIDTFGEILSRSRIPVCYNGNINTAEQYRSILGRFGDDPLFTGVMIGRGLIANPALVREIRGGDSLDAATLRAFHDEVLAGYQEELSGDTHVISKMKELWWYMGTMFLNAEKPLKRLRKSKNVREYKAAVCEVLRCEIRR